MFATLTVVVLVATTFHGRPLTCTMPQRLVWGVTTAELTWAYDPSDETTPLNVIPQLKFAMFGVVSTNVPGALNEVPAGAIVAANAVEHRVAYITTTAPLHTRIFNDFIFTVLMLVCAE
ncbi:hypothetical protein NID80_10345 [Paraburkholderia megapolitana]|nr:MULTISPECIES: hypothetical protein [Paraburkholderia]MCX4161869.1 hypothetical protein [Paraburkholderia megapolitana]MDN7157366.1 hypothetical protein [Paraburkholderia sp. CHISQ3]MDQ6494411.1 hypothetical protein [Paraburkholderia megapolitana]